MTRLPAPGRASLPASGRRSLRVGGSAFAVVDLPIAPLHVGIGAVEGGEFSGFLFLGPLR